MVASYFTLPANYPHTFQQIPPEGNALALPAGQRQLGDILQLSRTFPGELTYLCTSRHVRFFFSTAKGELISAPMRHFNQEFNGNPTGAQRLLCLQVAWSPLPWATPGCLLFCPQEGADFVYKWSHLSGLCLCESRFDVSQPKTGGPNTSFTG